MPCGKDKCYKAVLYVSDWSGNIQLLHGNIVGEAVNGDGEIPVYLAGNTV